MIRDREKRQLGEIFRALVNPVKIIYFTQEFECDYCRETGQLLREVSDLSDRISLETYNFQLDREKVDEYHVDKIPATVIVGGRDYGIRLYGVPAGYEFTSLVEAITDVSRGDSGLRPETREKLRAVNAPVHMQVLVTPT